MNQNQKVQSSHAVEAPSNSVANLRSMFEQKIRQQNEEKQKVQQTYKTSAAQRINDLLKQTGSNTTQSQANHKDLEQDMENAYFDEKVLLSQKNGRQRQTIQGGSQIKGNVIKELASVFEKVNSNQSKFHSQNQLGNEFDLNLMQNNNQIRKTQVVQRAKKKMTDLYNDEDDQQQTQQHHSSKTLLDLGKSNKIDLNIPRLNRNFNDDPYLDLIKGDKSGGNSKKNSQRNSKDASPMISQRTSVHVVTKKGNQFIEEYVPIQENLFRKKDETIKMKQMEYNQVQQQMTYTDEFDKDMNHQSFEQEQANNLDDKAPIVTQIYENQIESKQPILNYDQESSQIQNQDGIEKDQIIEAQQQNNLQPIQDNIINNDPIQHFQNNQIEENKIEQEDYQNNSELTGKINQSEKNKIPTIPLKVIKPLNLPQQHHTEPDDPYEFNVFNQSQNQTRNSRLQPIGTFCKITTIKEASVLGITFNRFGEEKFIDKLIHIKQFKFNRHQHREEHSDQKQAD
eukprot:403365994